MPSCSANCVGGLLSILLHHQEIPSTESVGLAVADTLGITGSPVCDSTGRVSNLESLPLIASVAYGQVSGATSCARMWAVQALGNYDAEQVQAALTWLVQNDPSADIREAATKALKRLTRQQSPNTQPLTESAVLMKLYGTGPITTPMNILKKCSRVLLLLLGAAVLLNSQSPGAGLSWSGLSPTSSNWNDKDNWDGVNIPANGDALLFRAVAAQHVNSNNISSLTLSQICFSGAGGDYVISGNPVTLTGSIRATNSVATTNTINNNITLNTANVTLSISNGVTLTLAGALSGTVGLTKSDVGTLTLSGNSGNTYAGPTVVTGGLLQLAKTAAHGAISAGSLMITNATVRELVGNQLGSIPVTIGSDGLLDLNGFSDSIGANLTLDSGGGVDTGTGGTLVLSNNSTVNVTEYGSISGAGTIFLNGPCTFKSTWLLDLWPSVNGPGSITKTGSGDLRLYGSNSYTGLTVVQQGGLWAENPLALGAAGTEASGTVVSNGASLVLYRNIAITNEALTLNGPGVSASHGALESWSAMGVGDVWVGPINLRADSTIHAAYTGYLAIPGSIGGAGGLTILPGGLVWLGGTNTYAGKTIVNSATLMVYGSQPQSPVVLTNGTLAGSGTVGHILGPYQGGTISPGYDVPRPGILTCSNLTLTNYSSGYVNPVSYLVDLTGPTPGTGYDQLHVRGTNNLGTNTTLTLVVAFTNANSPPALYDQFVIMNNDGTNAVTGTFVGLTNGATIPAAGFKFAINYNGGDGNDVVLTLVDTPIGQAGSTVTSGNGDGFIDPNECDTLNLVITNKSATPMTGITATLSSADPSILVTQPSSTYPDVPGYGKGTNLALFQISTLPSFVCGSNVNLNLTVATTSHGTFTTPMVLKSGGASAVPLRYDVSASTNVPGGGTIESTNVVSGFNGALTKVAVSLWLNHPLDANLSISLVSPDGTNVDLSSGNGNGADFGHRCDPDTNRTTFDDAAATAITAGTPPYVGTFRPEGSLASSIGGTANGNWRLRIINSASGSSGTLHCWALFLYPVGCTPGGGACAFCPVTITTTLTASSAWQTGRLVRDCAAAACGSAKACPALADSLLRHYEAYPFYNGGSNTCVTVTLSALGSALFSAAYLGSFDPANPCANYLADPGDSTDANCGAAGPRTYGFNVPANSVFVVTVNEIGTELSETPYTLVVSGNDCTPILSMAPSGSGSAAISWPVVAGGYQLEASPTLVPAAWVGVTNEPIASANRFDVTNTTATPTNRFYRLRKP